MRSGLLLLLLTSLMFGCFFEEKKDNQNVVLLEDVIFISSNKVRLLGRIYSAKDNISDHGFYVSTTESFENPIVSSLGSKDRLGLFLVEYDSLSQETNYFYKAYLVTNGEITFSEVSTVSTFKAQVNSRTPGYGKKGDIVTIDGTNLTNEVNVYFGDIEAKITKRVSDIQIQVEVPDHGNESRVPIIVALEGNKVLADNFEYITGRWTLVKEFNFGIFEPLQFKIGSKLTLGFGSTNKFFQISNLFYSIDLDTYEVISEVISGEDLPTPVIGSFFTETGYFGGGSYGANAIQDGEWEYLLNDEFWKYEEGTFLSLGNLNVDNNFNVKTHNSIAFGFEEALYVIGGVISQEVNNRFEQVPNSLVYKYSEGAWSLISSVPIIINGYLPNTSIENEHWFLTKNQEFWSYSPTTGAFKKLSTFRDGTVGNYGKMHYLNSKIYFGLFQFQEAFWQMNKDDLNILPKNNFPGKSNYITISSFENDGALFFFRIPTGSIISPMELWKFEPNEFE